MRSVQAMEHGFYSYQEALMNEHITHVIRGSEVHGHDPEIAQQGASFMNLSDIKIIIFRMESFFRIQRSSGLFKMSKAKWLISMASKQQFSSKIL